ncbi:MAG: hypothetical protein H6684_10835 [Deltaproteobacteria bacterium]|nr:hypothetical protein [Deltaproteobacteria bacterium]MCB9489216.1 hypothetical protein [Deltaproteobacteria bacterium]
MDRLGRSLAAYDLARSGYLAALDVSFAMGEDGATGRFDVVGVKLADGRVEAAVVGLLRAWWHPTAHLTPSTIRRHLQPGLTEALSDGNIAAFRAAWGLGEAPVERVLYFSHASPEKADEAESLLASLGIRPVYLERVAAELAQAPPGKEAPADIAATQFVSLVRGIGRQTALAAQSAPATRPRPSADEGIASPQLDLKFFRDNLASSGPTMESDA